MTRWDIMAGWHMYGNLYNDDDALDRLDALGFCPRRFGGRVDPDAAEVAFRRAAKFNGYEVEDGSGLDYG